jgi:hypothetical protein
VDASTLIDRQLCADLVARYCRAIDRLDETLLRSVFHPDSEHHHGFHGPSTAPGEDDFVAFAFGFLSTCRYTHHHLGSVLVEVDGDAAVSEAYFTAYHRLRARSDPAASADAAASEMDYWVGGRYLDRMEKRNSEWRIVRRVGTTDWTRLEPPAGAAVDTVDARFPPRRSHDDPVYGLFEPDGGA